MKIQISAKNYPMSEKLSNYIEKKLGKLDKYFNEDVTANVVVSKLRDVPKFEATINAKQAVFRAEMTSSSAASALRQVIFDLTVPEKSTAFCGTTPMLRRSAETSQSFTSRPPTRTAPERVS